jgi:2-polyprenyl-3-methyl-5-hydroxy-6-metoxy-1,4-benzoquinol methylase
MKNKKNKKVIKSFGDEWDRFKNNKKELEETLYKQFLAYTEVLRKFEIPIDAVAADFGAGSGRWAKYFSTMFKSLIIIEPSAKAIEVARQNLHGILNVEFKQETIEESTISENSLDVAISLGVLHHTTDTYHALKSIVTKLKSGGIFLGYLYYNLENKNLSYRVIWKLSDLVRKTISKLPKFPKIILADLIAVIVYWPFARYSKSRIKRGGSVESIPLHHYHDMPIYMMRNDALDRFGTQVERRFSKAEIRNLLKRVGFDVETITFSDNEPFWTFAAKKL